MNDILIAILALLGVIAILVIVSYWRIRRDRNSVFVHHWYRRQYYVRPAKKTPPEGTLCAICLTSVTNNNYGQTVCCENFLHVKCVHEYQNFKTSNKCCLCQSVVGNAPAPFTSVTGFVRP
jgi:hypothetical protein